METYYIQCFYSNRGTSIVLEAQIGTVKRGTEIVRLIIVVSYA